MCTFLFLIFRIFSYRMPHSFTFFFRQVGNFTPIPFPRLSSSSSSPPLRSLCSFLLFLRALRLDPPVATSLLKRRDCLRITQGSKNLRLLDRGGGSLPSFRTFEKLRKVCQFYKNRPLDRRNYSNPESWFRKNGS